MYPILVRYGPYFLYSYTVVMASGLLAGLVFTARLNRLRPLSHWLDVVCIGLGCGLVGGRMGFVAGQWHYFQERPLQSWQLWQGGLSYHAALLAGLWGCWLACRFLNSQNKTVFPNYIHYLNLFAPGFALAQAFGWAACWLEGCAYGQQTTLGWLAADLPDEFGVFAVRYQTQLLGVLLSLLIWLLLWYCPFSFRFAVMVAGLGIGRLFISLLRSDPVLMSGTLRIDTLLEGVLVFLSLLLLLQYTLIEPPTGSPQIEETL